jgi:hypothetical protein
MYVEATKLDQYLAIAYFQEGVSNFLLGEFEEALGNFNDALLVCVSLTLLTIVSSRESLHQLRTIRSQIQIILLRSIIQSRVELYLPRRYGSRNARSLIRSQRKTNRRTRRHRRSNQRQSRGTSTLNPTNVRDTPSFPSQ